MESSDDEVEPIDEHPLSHDDLPQGSERDIIQQYFYKGLPYRHIILMLEKHHNICMSQTTLKRRLKDYDLTRRKELDNEYLDHVRYMISMEIENGPDSLNGYRTMWHVLRLRHHINVPRHVVESIMREVDPQGVAYRKNRCLKRRTYVSRGPNFCWHMDGYHKLKPFGFCIHGCVDGFSRRIIWLEVQRSNKNPSVVAKYFLDSIRAARGCPARVYTDPGTENGLVAAIQCYLRGEGSEYAGSLAHKYVTSTSNQRIECQWSHFRKQRSSWWIDFFNDLIESDILNLTIDLHKEALWFCFAELIQGDLDKVKDYWNSHRIRKSKYALIAGVPDMMYFLPEEFGRSDCLFQVSTEKVMEMENMLQQRIEENDETDPIFEEYFQYVMENNGLQHPTTALEAGILFEKLLSFAFQQT